MTVGDRVPLPVVDLPRGAGRAARAARGRPPRRVPRWSWVALLALVAALCGCGWRRTGPYVGSRPMTALRIQALTLTVPELARVDKFGRWALQMTTAEEEPVAWARCLGWGSEDRVRLIEAPTAEAAGAVAEEAVTLRMEAAPLAGVAEWLRERGLAPVAATVSPEDGDAARALWPDAPVACSVDDAEANRTVVSVRGPAEPRVDLLFPLPKESLTPRKRLGPFTWRSADWKGLEIPGLLGVTTGAPDPAAMRAFLESLGATPMEDGDPLAIGDHQWIVEERKPGGIYGWAVVVSAARVNDLARTMNRLEIPHRQDKNRLVAADPAGRIVLVHGVHAG